MVTTYKIENDLNKNLKDILLKMDKEEFQEYFKQLIKNYYAVLFTYQNNHSKYYEESIKQYDLTIRGKVLGWLEEDYLDESTSKQYYKLYIGSEGLTYLSTGKP